MNEDNTMMAIVNESPINKNSVRMLLVSAAWEVFGKMVSLEVEEVFIGEIAEENEEIISASVAFAGEWNGYVMFRCGENLASHLASKLLHVDHKELHKFEVRNAMGEIVNIIGGCFRSHFTDQLNDGIEAFKLSIPSVVIGKDFNIFSFGSDIEIDDIHLSLGRKYHVELSLKDFRKKHEFGRPNIPGHQDSQRDQPQR